MITRALAVHLHAAGYGTLNEGVGGGDLFWEHMPATPDAAVMLLSTGGNPTPSGRTWGYDAPTVQIMVRGEPNDAVTPQRRAAELYGALQGLRYTTLDSGGDDEVFLCWATSLQTAPVNIGQDEKGRYRYVLNFDFLVRNVTAHRD